MRAREASSTATFHGAPRAAARRIGHIKDFVADMPNIDTARRALKGQLVKQHQREQPAVERGPRPAGKREGPGSRISIGVPRGSRVRAPCSTRRLRVVAAIRPTSMAHLEVSPPVEAQYGRTAPRSDAMRATGSGSTSSASPAVSLGWLQRPQPRRCRSRRSPASWCRTSLKRPSSTGSGRTTTRAACQRGRLSGGAVRSQGSACSGFSAAGAEASQSRVTTVER